MWKPSMIRIRSCCMLLVAASLRNTWKPSNRFSRDCTRTRKNTFSGSLPASSRSSMDHAGHPFPGSLASRLILVYSCLSSKALSNSTSSNAHPFSSAEAAHQLKCQDWKLRPRPHFLYENHRTDYFMAVGCSGIGRQTGGKRTQ